MVKTSTSFKKGQSGNLKGRPVGARSYNTIYWEAMKKIGESQGKTPEEIEDILVQSGLKNALKGDYRFYQDAMDRKHGKPKQAVELTGEDGGDIKQSITIEFVNANPDKIN